MGFQYWWVESTLWTILFCEFLEMMSFEYYAFREIILSVVLLERPFSNFCGFGWYYGCFSVNFPEFIIMDEQQSDFILTILILTQTIF